MKAPTKATRLLIKLAQNVTSLRNDAQIGSTVHGLNVIELICNHNSVCLE